MSRGLVSRSLVGRREGDAKRTRRILIGGGVTCREATRLTQANPKPPSPPSSRNLQPPMFYIPFFCIYNTPNFSIHVKTLIPQHINRQPADSTRIQPHVPSVTPILAPLRCIPQAVMPSTLLHPPFPPKPKQKTEKQRKQSSKTPTLYIELAPVPSIHPSVRQSIPFYPIPSFHPSFPSQTDTVVDTPHTHTKFPSIHPSIHEPLPTYHHTPAIGR